MASLRHALTGVQASALFVEHGPDSDTRCASRRKGHRFWILWTSSAAREFLNGCDMLRRLVVALHQGLSLRNIFYTQLLNKFTTRSSLPPCIAFPPIGPPLS